MKFKSIIFLLLVCLKTTASDFVVLQSEKAGNLQLTEDALTATNLKIVGHIDARDFATLKEVTINRTRVLDLSEAHIDSYTGYGCWINLGSSNYVQDVNIKYQENVLPNYAFSEARDNSLSKWCEGSYTLREIILPKNLVDIGPSAFAACSALKEIRIEEGSLLKSVDNAIVYTQDEKRLVSVAPAYSGKLSLSPMVEAIDSCALEGVMLSGLSFNSPHIPSIKNASLIKTPYVQSSQLEECKQIFPDVDCVEEIKTITIQVNEQDDILATLGNMGYRRNDVRSVVVTGILSANDLTDLFALPNLYYADLSNAKTTSARLVLSGTKLCEVKLPKGNYYLSMTKNDYLIGNLVIPEGVNGLSYNGNRHTSVVCPSTLMKLDDSSFGRIIHEADFSACKGLQEISGFYNCSNLESLLLPSSLEILSGVSGAPIKHIDIPNSVHTLTAFAGCDLEEIILPESLIELGSIKDMAKLKNIDASKAVSLKTINSGTFDGCPFVLNVDFSNCPLTYFYGFNGGRDVAPNTRVVVMGGTKYPAPKIANKLSSVKMPSTLENIEGFNNSPLLKEVNLEHCYRLKEIEGFENCIQLEKIAIPSATTTFNLTLNGCDNLKTIRCASLQPPATSASLDSEKLKQITLCVPIGCRGVYYMSEGWSNCKDVVEVGYSVMVDASSSASVVIGSGMYDKGMPVTLTAAPYLANELQYANVYGWFINDEWMEGDTVTFVPTANCMVRPEYRLSAPDFSMAKFSFSLNAKNDTTHYIKLGLQGSAKIYGEDGVLFETTKTDGYRDYTLQLHKGIQKFAITGDLYHARLNDYNQYNTTDLQIKDKEILYLDVPSLGLQDIDLINCPNLTDLSCYNNQLQTLDLSVCPNLEYLSCRNNQLQSLDLSVCPNLESLYCYNNQLQSLDLSACPNLEYLSCSNNQLQSLDLSACPNLASLNCDNNQLQSLLIENCSKLQSLYVNDNELKQLYVTSDSLQRFNWQDNPLAFSCLTPQIYEKLKQSDQISDHYKSVYSFKVLGDMIDEEGVLDLTYELNANAYSSNTEFIFTGVAEKVSNGKYTLSDPNWNYQLILKNSNYPQLEFVSHFSLAKITGIQNLVKDNLKIRITDGFAHVSGLSEMMALSLVSSNGMVLDRVNTSNGEALLLTRGFKGVCILQLSRGGKIQKIKVRVI